jgi:hypothetical protein
MVVICKIGLVKNSRDCNEEKETKLTKEEESCQKKVPHRA